MDHPFRSDPRVGEAERRLMDALPEQRQLIHRAVEMAGRAHHGQQRKSGEPFLLHPLAVAELLAEQGLSAETVIAGILHDVLEDTDCPAEQIADQFGQEVLFLVQGVTKMTKVAPRGTPQRDKPETFRKLILGAAADARVLVVKLADRLHNMRTIGAMPPGRQQAIARETLQIYAPIAHRLGMGRFKDELEDLSFRVLEPDAWEEARLIQQERVGRVGAYLDELKMQAQQALDEAGIHAQLSTRVKSRYSIAEKLKRRGDREQILDVLGMRVIVDDEDDCYRALGVMHRLWPPLFDRFKDFIATPKSNLYQSLHTTVIHPNGRPCEIQIRTARMHDTAEHGIAAHWHYKETLRAGGPASTRRFLKELADSQREEERMEEAFTALKHDVLGDEIYVFTPKGDLRLLPAGSCAIDLAYAVHTELGHRCVGARVNGVLKPITRPLKAGDVVEIITRPDAKPSRDWLGAVASARARQRIRQFHQAADEEGLVKEGMQVLAAQLRAAGLGPLAAGDRLRAALRELGYERSEQAAVEAARDRTRARQIVERLVRQVAAAEPEAEAREVRAASRARAMTRDTDAGVLVDGMEGVHVRLAQCCSPEPGDAICGYVSLHRGVVVHRNDCPNVSEHRRRRSPRLIAVSWRTDRQTSFRAELELIFIDRPELLSDLALVVYGVGSELAELNLKSNGHVVRGTMACLVSSAEQSEQIRDSLREMEGALRVRRRLGG